MSVEVSTVYLTARYDIRDGPYDGSNWLNDAVIHMMPSFMHVYLGLLAIEKRSTDNNCYVMPAFFVQNVYEKGITTIGSYHICI